MREVSSRAFDIFHKPLKERGIPLASLLEGTNVTVAMLRDKNARIDWADLCVFMANLRPHCDDEQLREMGRAYFRLPMLRFLFVVARVLFTPLEFYRWINKPRGGGNQIINCIVPTQREITQHELEIDLTLGEEHEVCWEFFVITSGNFEEMPKLLGLPPAKVRLSSLPRGARFHITLPNKTPFLTRLRRLLTWPFTIRAAARELKDAHETLVDRYDELEDARTKLDRQATQLRTAHAVNDLLLRELDLGRTLDIVARALVEQAGFRRAEIVLTGAAPRSVSYGTAEEHDQPLRRTLEASGGDEIGELRVSPQPGDDRGEREDLLALITPTLATGLQNALYRSGLEALVDERTTALTQARDELAGTVDQLREAQGARERFFGNISHEIRTPLTIIMLAAADIELRAGAALDVRARAGLGAVTDAARKLVRLVDELLLLAAGQEGKLRTNQEPTDLCALAAQLVAAWRPGAEAADLAFELRTPEVLIANVDPVAIERVATNLVSNAVKYTPRGGRVEVELVAGPDGIRLSVFDTGPGFDADLAGRVFGRFERAAGEDRRKAGTGLGLSLAKQLVEAHGGTIEVCPRPTGGSELRVMLPASLVLAEPAAGQPREVAHRPLRLVEATGAAPSVASGTRLGPTGISSGTILLAEDDSRLADQVAQLLADEYVVIVAHDGAAALELVKLHQPQLLITDVDMPGLNGIELSRRFREQTGDRLAPIIILSAMLDLGTRVAGLDAGAIDYVTKPFDPVELKARVRAQFRMRELALRLHRAEQLSALGILTAGLAHELRNPANGIVNAITPLAEMLPPELVSPDTGPGQLIEVIQSCADQIAFLSRQLLGFRNNSIELELRSASLPDIIDRSITLAQRALYGVELRNGIADDLEITCAPPLMTQVLSNLIENAAHAAGRGGWVDLRTRIVGPRIHLEVSDSGAGVPPELRDRVFEPFFTTKPPGVGTGLGLSLARDIIHRHGGVLEIRDRGTRVCFVIELPHRSSVETTAHTRADAV